jgi:hypothetical protein
MNDKFAGLGESAGRTWVQPTGCSRPTSFTGLSSRSAMNFEWRRWFTSVQAAYSMHVITLKTLLRTGLVHIYMEISRLRRLSRVLYVT